MAFSKIILNGTTLMDVTGDTVASSNLLYGYSATGADGEAVSGAIAAKTSADLVVSGNSVTAPAGYYSSNASANVSSGSVSVPATSITANPTVTKSGGDIVATVSASQSVSPSVSAGYVTSGTAGTMTVSGSASVPATSLDANLLAENIKDSVTIFGVTGNYSGGGGGGLTLVTESGVTPTAYIVHETTNYKLVVTGLSGEPQIVYVRATSRQQISSNGATYMENVFFYKNSNNIWIGRMGYGTRQVSYYAQEGLANGVDLVYSNGDLDIFVDGLKSSLTYDIYLFI